MKYFIIGIPVISVVVTMIIKIRDVVLINSGMLIESKSLQYSLLFFIAANSAAIFIAGNNNAFVNKSLMLLLGICVVSFVVFLCLSYLLYQLPDFLFHKPRWFIAVDSKSKMKVDVLHPIFFGGILLITYLLNFICFLIILLSPKIDN